MDTALPPKFRRVLISCHRFVQAQRNGGFEIKPPLIGVLIRLLHNGFFYFAAVWQAFYFRISEPISAPPMIKIAPNICKGSILSWRSIAENTTADSGSI